MAILARDKLGRILNADKEPTFKLPFDVDPLTVFWPCRNCKQTKDATQFYIAMAKNKKSYRRGTAWCRKCHSRWASQNNGWKEQRRRYWLNKYKVAKRCAHCGYNQSAVAIDFHHQKDSKKDDIIASMMTNSPHKLFAEIVTA